MESPLGPERERFRQTTQAEAVGAGTGAIIGLTSAVVVFVKVVAKDRAEGIARSSDSRTNLHEANLTAFNLRNAPQELQDYADQRVQEAQQQVKAADANIPDSPGVMAEANVLGGLTLLGAVTGAAFVNHIRHRRYRRRQAVVDAVFNEIINNQPKSRQ